MQTYQVIWEIEIEADSPEAAAREAREIQLDGENIATEYDVYPAGSYIRPTSDLITVDLGADDEAD